MKIQLSNILYFKRFFGTFGTAVKSIRLSIVLRTASLNRSELRRMDAV